MKGRTNRAGWPPPLLVSISLGERQRGSQLGHRTLITDSAAPLREPRCEQPTPGPAAGAGTAFQAQSKCQVLPGHVVTSSSLQERLALNSRQGPHACGKRPLSAHWAPAAVFRTLSCLPVPTSHLLHASSSNPLPRQTEPPHHHHHASCSPQLRAISEDSSGPAHCEAKF